MTNENHESDEYEFDESAEDLFNFFHLFEQDPNLRPHHNEDSKELLTQLNRQTNGEMIYYYKNIGSFWFKYGEEADAQGLIAQGEVEPKPKIEKHFPLDPKKSPMELLDRNDHYLVNQGQGLSCTMNVPWGYYPPALENSIVIAEAIMDWPIESVDTSEPNVEILMESIMEA